MTYHILPGSLEIDDDILTAGVHTGPSEWSIENLRYVQASISGIDKDTTLVSLLSKVYDESEGCLVKGTFKMSR